MPKIKYAIEKGGPKRLEISWKGNYKEITIHLDGNTIGSIADPEQLKAGQEFSLEDGSTLKVQLTRSFIFPHLQIYKDGWPVHSQGFEPAQQLSYAYKFIFLIGGMNLAFGLSGILFRTALWNLPPAGLLSVILGGFFLVLGFFVMRRSIIALSIAAGILALDVVLTIIFPPNLPRFALVIGIIFRIFVLLAMAQGFGAIQALKQSKPCSK